MVEQMGATRSDKILYSSTSRFSAFHLCRFSPPTVCSTPRRRRDETGALGVHDRRRLPFDFFWVADGHSTTRTRATHDQSQSASVALTFLVWRYEPQYGTHQSMPYQILSECHVLPDIAESFLRLYQPAQSKLIGRNVNEGHWTATHTADFVVSGGGFYGCLFMVCTT